MRRSPQGAQADGAPEPTATREHADTTRVIRCRRHGEIVSPRAPFARGEFHDKASGPGSIIRATGLSGRLARGIGTQRDDRRISRF